MKLACVKIVSASESASGNFDNYRAHDIDGNKFEFSKGFSFRRKLELDKTYVFSYKKAEDGRYGLRLFETKLICCMNG